MTHSPKSSMERRPQETLQEFLQNKMLSLMHPRVFNHQLQNRLKCIINAWRLKGLTTELNSENSSMSSLSFFRLEKGNMNLTNPRPRFAAPSKIGFPLNTHSMYRIFRALHAPTHSRSSLNKIYSPIYMFHKNWEVNAVLLMMIYKFFSTFDSIFSCFAMHPLLRHIPNFQKFLRILSQSVNVGKHICWCRI